jgi:Uma2 family endonuclease
MSTNITKKLFTTDEYLRMAETGILSESDRVELIYGEILTMSPVGCPHAATVDRFTRALVRTAGDNAIVRVQASVQLSEYSQPQPDISLLRPKDDFYYSKHPGPSDILLLIEVADSSLQYDQTIKAGLYAESGIAEYWIVDLQNDRFFAYSEPKGRSYGLLREYHRGDAIAPSLLPECHLQINDLLP